MKRQLETIKKFIIFFIAILPAIPLYLGVKKGEPYFIGVGILFMITNFLVLYYLVKPFLTKTASKEAFRCTTTLIALMIAGAAILLERDILQTIRGDRDLSNGLPLHASMVLLFVATFIYTYSPVSKREVSRFSERKMAQVLSFSAIFIILISFLAAIFKISLNIFLVFLKTTFFLTAISILQSISSDTN